MHFIYTNPDPDPDPNCLQTQSSHKTVLKTLTGKEKADTSGGFPLLVRISTQQMLSLHSRLK